MDKIFATIIHDLSIYGQDNPAPDSLTIGEGKNFRHYGLASCFGLVAFNEGHVFISEIKEDDMNWFCYNGTDKQYSDAHWLETRAELYLRMKAWLDKNFQCGYYSGNEGKEGFECGYTNFK